MSLMEKTTNLNHRMTYHPIAGIITLLLSVQTWLKHLQIARIQFGKITPVSTSSNLIQ